MKKLISLLLIFVLSLTLVSCGEQYNYNPDKINVTTTTNIIADLTNEIGGNKVNIYSLMGAGVDPHQYVTRPRDYIALSEADLVVVSGLHLEGKMADVIRAFGEQKDKHVLLLGDNILKESSNELKSLLIESELFGDNYDPHFWFDIELYKEASRYLYLKLSEIDPDSNDYYYNNYMNYLIQLDELHDYVLTETNRLNKEDKILITAHDAFEYFGVTYGFEVYSLQGLSTEDEVSPSDIKEVINIIIDKNVKAVFPETSVPVETITSVKEAVKSRGIDLHIGNDLYSDSIGEDEDDNTYIKMYKKNVSNIVETILSR